MIKKANRTKREKKMAGSGSRTHILVLPYPAQGHINPMLQFSKRLASKGLKVSLISSSSNMSKSIHARATTSNYVNIQDITDDYEDGESQRQRSQSVEAYMENLKSFIAHNMVKIIEKQNNLGCPVSVLVYDSMMPWALDIAHSLGLKGASFITQSCSVSAIYYHVNQGTLKIPTDADGSAVVSVPSLPQLRMSDLPSFVFEIGSSYPYLLQIVVGQFSNFQQADWIFINTFDSLEDEIFKWMGSQRKIKTIGPTIPSKYLDKRLTDDKDYGLNLLNPNVEACMKWLDSKPIRFVVYVSFGSLANLTETQMKELSQGLLISNSHFLWVVRASEENKLPSNFMLESSEKGLVVNWCPQLDVLAHKGVGCFMSHCGWNSTLEALSLGVPMIAMPQWTDQTTNAKFIADVWRVGIRVKFDEKGIVRREEIEKCINEMMREEKGNDMKMNAEKWKELAKQAVDECGSSDNNVEEFISRLICT